MRSTKSQKDSATSVSQDYLIMNKNILLYLTRTTMWKHCTWTRPGGYGIPLRLRPPARRTRIVHTIYVSQTNPWKEKLGLPGGTRDRWQFFRVLNNSGPPPFLMLVLLTYKYFSTEWEHSTRKIRRRSFGDTNFRH